MQLKTMLKGDDWQAVQNLVDNRTIIFNDQTTTVRFLTSYRQLQKIKNISDTTRMRFYPILGRRQMKAYTVTQQLHHYTSQQLQMYTGIDKETLQIVLLQHVIKYHET